MSFHSTYDEKSRSNNNEYIYKRLFQVFLVHEKS